MHKYVGHGTRAAKGSDLDQVLRGLRDNSRRGPPLGALFPGYSSARLNLPTLPGSASVVFASCCGRLRKYRFLANLPFRSKCQMRSRTYKTPKFL